MKVQDRVVEKNGFTLLRFSKEFEENIVAQL